MLSAYGDWQCVLNRYYCPYENNDEGNRIEFEKWCDDAEAAGIEVFKESPLPEPWESGMIASWNNIFEIEARYAGRIIQVTFEKLELTEVVSVTEFTSQGR